MKYKWCERSGVIDESGRQVQQLSLTTTKKMRRECGKVLVDFLNGQTTERAKQMIKRYRRPKVDEGQIKVQRGNVDGAPDMCIFYGANTPRCDRALVMNYLCSTRLNWQQKVEPSLIEELEKRGYDLETLRFSIERKKPDAN